MKKPSTAITTATASGIGGIELSDGRTVLPGLTNSFAIEARRRWWQRHSLPVLYVSLFAVQAGALFGPQIGELNGADAYDSLPLAVFMGDLKPLSRNKKATIMIDVDDVFGNQFVKKKEDVYDVTGENDPRISGAQDMARMVGMGAATPPVDLTPGVQPAYPAGARSAGVSGTTMLEIVVGDDGKVLRVKNVGKQLGFGLEEAAAAAFRLKRYQPSMSQDGKALTVRFYQPVRFALN